MTILKIEPFLNKYGPLLEDINYYIKRGEDVDTYIWPFSKYPKLLKIKRVI